MGYADVLPSTTRRYEFKGIQHCLEIVEGPEEEDEQYEQYAGSTLLDGKYVIFTIDEGSFLDCFLNAEESSLRKSWEAYDPSMNELLVKTIESVPHSVGTGTFTHLFHRWLGPYDANYPLIGIGTTSCRGSSNNRKRPDCAWVPKHSGLDRKWPTIVVEVSYSETPAKMMRDVNFWLNESSGQVNIVLTVRIHERRRISIQQWKMGNRTPFSVQKLEIAKNPAPNYKSLSASALDYPAPLSLQNIRSLHTSFATSLYLSLPTY
ncbi:hypothetical protein VN97_g3570 [Penicillium thymicola]|uniref:Uncharacterized protein n=1 Tax=Penicillium thymicola TaxID=293382 RepID=A0AAI9TMC5_PENTH|nr:hypothetical protein VN97_g3570 [Penicillium thymicola]